jgi:two-component system chemotaxis response regulator CheB
VSAPGVPPFRAVALLASLGGLDAVSTVLAALPDFFPVPVLVVQHGRWHADQHRLTGLLARATPLPTRTLADGQPVRTAGVSVVPPGRDASVDAAGRFRLAPSDGLHGGDVLLPALAERFGPAVIGAVLTGMQQDGAAGARAVKRHGGRVLVQDPATARAAGMPSAAIATGCVDFVLPLDRIGPAVVALALAPGGADLLAVPIPSWARLTA